MGKITDIAEILAAELAAGKYPPGARFPSEYELAERFGVGRVTVNKAVSMLVSAGRLERGVRGSGTRVRARNVYPRKHVVYLGNFTHPFFARVLHGVCAAAFFRDYGVESAIPDLASLAGYLDKVCASNHYAGIITNGYSMLDPERWPVPVVYVDTCNPEYDPACFHVANRNYEGARRLAEAVLAHGHREIAVYTNCDYLSSHRYYRVNGFLDALRAAGIDRVEERLFVGMNYSTFDAAAVLGEIRSRFPETTVIMTPTDNLAQVICQVLLKEGSSDICVTGFGNVTGISDVYGIAGADQHPFHLGTEACNMLLDLYEGKLDRSVNIRYVDVEPVNLNAIPKISRKRSEA